MQNEINRLLAIIYKLQNKLELIKILINKSCALEYKTCEMHNACSFCDKLNSYSVILRINEILKDKKAL